MPLGMLTHHAKQLHDKSKSLGKVNIDRAHPLNAAHVNLLWIHCESIGKCCQKDCLVSCVPTVDIESRIGLGVSQLLGFPQCLLIAKTSFCHPLQYVIRCAVDNTHHRLNAVTHKALLHGLNNRYAPGNSCFKVNRRVKFIGESKELLASLSEQGLVTCDHRLTGPQCSSDNVKGGVGAADKLDYDVNLGIVDDLFPVRRELFLRNLHEPGLPDITHCNAHDLHLHTTTIRNQLSVAHQGLPHSSTYSSESRESYTQ